jgi:hypothetical protein
MKIPKKPLLRVVIFVLLFTAVALSLYLFLPRKLLFVEDQSQNYNIAINETNKQRFIEYLQKMGALKKNYAVVKGGKYFTIQKLTVIITDKNNGIYTHKSVDKSTISSVTFNADEGKGTLNISVYINPNKKNKGEAYLSNELFGEVIVALRSSVGVEHISPQQAIDATQKDMRSFNKELPFIVTSE